MPLDTSPSPPPSYFDKIPLELIQLIVGYVREQDKVFLKSGVRRAKPAVRYPPKWNEDGDLTDAWRQADKEARTVPLEGKWSCWLGRGMAALSLVNKQLRGLTFVSLCETVTLKQLAKPFFLGSIAQRREIVAVMRHLDLRDDNVDYYVLGAPFLSRVPVNRITLDNRTEPLIDADGFGEAATSDMATSAMAVLRDFARTINSFEAHDLDVDELEYLLGSLELSVLRELKITYPGKSSRAVTEPFSFEEANPSILQAFRQMSRLETLTIEDEGALADNYAVDPSWIGSVSLPSLRSLTISGHESPQPLLDLTTAMAPNLRSIIVDEVQSWCSVEAPSIPSLRHLTVRSQGRPDLSLPPVSSLVTLTIHTSLSEIDEDPLVKLFPPAAFPTTLRLVTVHLYTTVFPVDEVAQFRAACSVRGIRVHAHWRPDLYTLRSALSEEGYDEPEEASYSWQPVAVAAALDALDWARRTIEHAAEVEDDRTVHEVVQALLRVRERQAISLQ
ncbi:hypothetical protein JCM6882_004857 [Rhodosporidiobolus microsporus]